MKKKLFLSLAFGILLSSAALYLAFRDVPLSDLLAYMGAIDYVWVIPAVALVVIGFILRAVRWRIILSTAQNVNFWQSYHPLMIGFMLNCILPGRIGEAARPLILNRREAVSFTTGLATVAAERFMDAVFMIVFLVLALATVPMDASPQVSFGNHQLSKETLETLGAHTVRLCLLLLAGMLLVAFNKTRDLLKRIINGLPDLVLFFCRDSFRLKIRNSVSLRVNRLLDHAGEGLLLIKHPRKLTLCIGITCLIWALGVVSYYVMAIGCPDVQLSLYEFSIVMVIICFFIALPSVPGFWGVWEAGGIFALSLFGVSSQTAAGFTLANHAVQMFPVMAMGFLSAAALSINVWKISYGSPPRP